MRRGAAGFTLLETIVALAVLGLLIAGLSQTIRFGLTAWHAEARLSDGRAGLQSVYGTLRVIVRNLSPILQSGNPPMTGGADALIGISRMAIPQTGLRATPVEVGLAVSGNRLILRWRPYLHADLLKARPPPFEATLIGGVAGLHIAYWKPSGGWVAAWNAPVLPRLVRMRVTFLGKHPPVWPDLVVAPLLSRP